MPTRRCARSAPEAFELAAVCDPRLGAAEEAAGLAEEILGSRPAVYSDHEELICERRRAGARPRHRSVRAPHDRGPGARRGPARDLREAARHHGPRMPRDRRCGRTVGRGAGDRRELPPGRTEPAGARCHRGRNARRPAPDDADRRRRRSQRGHQPVASHPRGGLARPRHGRALRGHLLLLPRRARVRLGRRRSSPSRFAFSRRERRRSRRSRRCRPASCGRPARTRSSHSSRPRPACSSSSHSFPPGRDTTGSSAACTAAPGR